MLTPPPPPPSLPRALALARTTRGRTDVKTSSRKSTSRRGTKRRKMCRAKGAHSLSRARALVVARNEHPSLNVPSFSAESVSAPLLPLPQPELRPGYMSRFILKMGGGRDAGRAPKRTVAMKNFKYGVYPPPPRLLYLALPQLNARRRPCCRLATERYTTSGRGKTREIKRRGE